MKKLTLAASAVVLAVCESAVAQMVPVVWDASGQFNQEVLVPSGKFVEACEKLPKGANVAWSFEAATPLDFNIHYHQGKEVRFPAKKDGVSKDAGTLSTKLEQDYCWMWTNKGSTDAVLRLKLAKS